MAVNEIVIAGRRRLVVTDRGGQTFTAFAEIKNVEDLKHNIAILKSIDEDNTDFIPYIEAVQSSINGYTEEHFQSIRGALGNFIGQKVVDITQIDDEEWEEGEHPYVNIMFENGSYLKMYSCGMGFEFFDALTGLDMGLVMPYGEDDDEDEEIVEK